jgi:hypothetical protein
MNTLILVILLLASPAWSQTKSGPKAAPARVDNCAPIGRTADGRFVYSLKCDNLPAPPPPPAQVEPQSAPAAEPEVERPGIFGMSYRRRAPNE